MQVKFLSIFDNFQRATNNNIMGELINQYKEFQYLFVLNKMLFQNILLKKLQCSQH